MQVASGNERLTTRACLVFYIAGLASCLRGVHILSHCDSLINLIAQQTYAGVDVLSILPQFLGRRRGIRALSAVNYISRFSSEGSGSSGIRSAGDQRA